MVRILLKYYKPSKTVLSIDELDQFVSKINMIPWIYLNEIAFRKAVRRYGGTFGGIFHALLDILNCSSIHPIITVKNSSIDAESFFLESNEESKEKSTDFLTQ